MIQVRLASDAISRVLACLQVGLLSGHHEPWNEQHELFFLLPLVMVPLLSFGAIGAKMSVPQSGTAVTTLTMVAFLFNCIFCGEVVKWPLGSQWEAPGVHSVDRPRPR